MTQEDPVMIAKIIGIDPGSKRSAIVHCSVVDGNLSLEEFRYLEPERSREYFDVLFFGLRNSGTKICIETITGIYGGHAAQDQCLTLIAQGKIEEQIWRAQNSSGRQISVDLMRRSRTTILASLGIPAGKKRGVSADQAVKRYLIGEYGGEAAAIGGKKCPRCKGKGWKGPGRPQCTECKGVGGEDKGPFYGWTGTHCWAAMACAYSAYLDLIRQSTQAPKQEQPHAPTS